LAAVIEVAVTVEIVEVVEVDRVARLPVGKAILPSVSSATPANLSSLRGGTRQPACRQAGLTPSINSQVLTTKYI